MTSITGASSPMGTQIPAELRTPAGAAVLAAWILGTLGCAGCSPAPPPPPRSGDVVALQIGERVVQAEVVFDDLSRKIGLMHRKRLGENEGMLFIFDAPERLGFWMRNTEIPLSIAFLDDDGTILEIADMKPKDLSTTRTKYRVRYALEVNQGWFQRAGISAGDVFRDFRRKIEAYTALAEPRRERGW